MLQFAAQKLGVSIRPSQLQRRHFGVGWRPLELRKRRRKRVRRKAEKLIERKKKRKVDWTKIEEANENVLNTMHYKTSRAQQINEV